MEEVNLKLTAVGALAIAGVVLLLVLLARFLRDRTGKSPKENEFS